MIFIMKFYLLFALWFVGLSIPAIYLAGTHTFSLLPSSEKNLNSLLPEKKSQQMQVLHFLGVDCDCSKNVFSSLLKRSPDQTLIERVYLIGEEKNWEKQLRLKGYDVVVGNKEVFSTRFDIQAVPQLSVFNIDGRLIYNGGYTSKRGPSSIVEDQTIIAGLKKNEHEIKQRPIFGCLNGTKLQKSADPLGLKYSYQ
jgi:hypothetical protein